MGSLVLGKKPEYISYILTPTSTWIDQYHIKCYDSAPRILVPIFLLKDILPINKFLISWDVLEIIRKQCDVLQGIQDIHIPDVLTTLATLDALHPLKDYRDIPTFYADWTNVNPRFLGRELPP